MPYLIIIRHGQSAWNLENRFTGVADIELTDIGIKEAERAGMLLKGFPVNIAFTSVLKRAIHTLQIILEETSQTAIPIVYNAALDERDYGDLQGLNKAETAKKFGDAQVLIWRRSFDVAPPGGESLKNTYDRVIPYYQKEVAPQLAIGKNILIVAHGNSLRALMRYLENISPEAIADVNLPTGVPRVYRFSPDLIIEKVSYLE